MKMNGRNSKMKLLLMEVIILLSLFMVLILNTTYADSNVAQGKTASADSQQSNNTAAKGNDGSTTTRWCANNGNLNHWWKVDLGSSYNLSSSEVMWEYNGRIYKYKVEISSDNTNWTLKVDKTNNTSTAQTQTDPFSGTARYVRITVTGLASGTWASFFEFRVFGSTGSTATPTPTSVVTPNPTPSFTPTPTATPIPHTPTPPPGWTLAWSDEFNGPTIDTTNWGYELGYKRNNELQYYTNRTENARIENSNLVIEAIRENYNGYGYTSASLITSGKREFQYGRFEMRAKIPTPLGSWPAWWTLGVANPWPKNGEIDIMEYYTGTILANIAYQNPSGSIVWDSLTKNISDYGPGWSDNYHIWVMEWDTNTINLYVDDWLFNTFNVSNADNGSYNPFRQRHYILANLAIGGTRGGDPSGTTFPLIYYIDYIRVYQK
jgi:beta-glucanase (GH16 family)